MPNRSKQNKNYPSYLRSYQNGTLQNVSDMLWDSLRSCQLCPRNCNTNRLEDKRGFCKIGKYAYVYSFGPHYGEEPPISGWMGSGTIFFSGCNMSCVYCQNYKFSQKETGKKVTPEILANFMLQLQEMNCHNINLVTPTHVIPQILKALLLAIPKGLTLPLVYNSSGYEKKETIRLLRGIVDIYLPDMRYAETNASLQYSSAKDYPQHNKESIKEMHKQVGIAKINDLGIITKGIIIRHLVLPNDICKTEEIMKFISQELSCQTYISLMSQYLPCYNASKFKELDRRITSSEYFVAQEMMKKYGLHNGWIQEEYGSESLAGPNLRPLEKRQENF